MKKAITFCILTGAILLAVFLGGGIQSTKETPIEQPFDVRKFGAKGDGKTDDSLSFNKAIDAAANAQGGEVYIPSGTYILQPIFLKSNVHLIGEDKDLVTLKLADSADDQQMTRLVNLEGVQNIRIQNLTFDGNYAKHQNGVEHMHTLFLWNSTNIVIENNRMQHAVGDGLSITGSKKASRNITVSNNFFLDNHRSNLVVEQANQVYIYNNHSKSTIGRPAIHFEPWEETTFQEARIHHNLFETNANEAYAIQIEGTPGEGNYYRDLQFYENEVIAPHGKFMIKETKSAQIYDNKLSIKELYVWFKNDALKVYDNTMETENGILMEGYLGTSIQSVFKNNTIHTKKNGVTVKSSAEDTTFTGNTFTGTGKEYAAYLWATEKSISNTVFEKNTFTNFKVGIATDTYEDHLVDGLTLIENHFEKIKKQPVYALKESSRRVKLEGNTFVQTGDVFIE